MLQKNTVEIKDILIQWNLSHLNTFQNEEFVESSCSMCNKYNTLQIILTQFGSHENPYVERSLEKSRHFLKKSCMNHVHA